MNEFIGSIIIAAVSIVIIRWVLSIDAFIKTSKTQIGLLILMAKKQGATEEEIDDVINKVYGKK